MSYHRALSYFAQLSMIFSGSLASTRGSTVEHGVVEPDRVQEA